MLFLAWLFASLFVVGAINLYLRHFGLPRSRSNSKQNGGTSFAGSFLSYSSAGATYGPGATISFGGRGTGGSSGDSTNWINATIAWVYRRCQQTPDFIDTWLKGLTLEAQKQSRDLEFKFEEIHGSPPEISNIYVEQSTTENFTVYATLILKDVTLRINSNQPTSKNLVVCDAYIYNLKGQMKIVTKYFNNEITQVAAFTTPPDLKMQIRPTRVNPALDTSTIDKIIRTAINNASTNLAWTGRSIKPNTTPHTPTFEMETASGVRTLGNAPIKPIRDQPLRERPVLNQPQRDQSFREQPIRTQPVMTIPMIGQRSDTISSVNNEFSGLRNTDISQSATGFRQNEFVTPSFDLLQNTPNEIGKTTTPVLGSTKKLLVRIIKANGLIETDSGSCSAYCLVHVDQPTQKFTTNFVKNTVNPYWDEQFVVETNSITKQIQMEILDREREPGNELLGKASVLLDEIRRMPSSRQIIPLTGKPRSRTATSGSITVEFVFMDIVQSSGSTPCTGTSELTTNVSEILVRPQERSETIGLGKSKESPTVVVTGADMPHTPQSFNQKAGGVQDSSVSKKKESLASVLKKKFNKMKQPRSQSADRAGNYLKPPSDKSVTLQVSSATKNISENDVDVGLRKARSNSFSSSLRRIFRIDKKDVSREGSLSRPAANKTDPYNRDLSLSQQEAFDRSRRQNTPIPSDTQYSISMPSAPSPLQLR